ncbi:hypothetical protein B4065_2615 [Caldibacillus thermoamylovorans]|nr:hypothetical protein B4065_2615 [Caldibacillus thermoamylovorans]
MVFFIKEGSAILQLFWSLTIKLVQSFLTLYAYTLKIKFIYSGRDSLI